MKVTRNNARQGEENGIYRALPVRMEGLEERRLLTAWSAQDLAIGLDKATQNYPSINGSGETVVIIDSGGIDYNHPALGGGLGNKITYTWNYDTNSSEVFPWDNNAHPTGVAGELAGDAHYVNGQLYQGVASGLKIIQLKANGTWEDKAAFDWVIAHRSQYNIVGVNWTDTSGNADAGQFLSELQTLRNNGVFVGAPTGNYGGTAYTVYNHLWYQTGSTNVWGQLSGYSPSGSAVDLYAPGEVTVVWYWNGQHMDYPSTGTSWSSPQTVGTAALIKQVNSRFTPDQIMSIMRDSANWSQGLPSLDVNAAIALAYQRSGQVTPPAAAPIPAPAPAPTPTPTPTPPPAPNATGSAPNGPFSLSATVSGSSVAFQFYDNSDTETGFVIERSTSQNGAYTAVAKLPASTGARQAVSYSDTTVSAGTTYYYRAYAVNGTYQSGVTTASVTTPTAAVTPTPTPTPTATGTTTPYLGTPFSTGSTIEAEWYDNGGTNVAFHTVSSGNESGHAFRGTDSVDVAYSAAAGSNYVGWTHAGEWLKYSINAPTAGSFQLQARVAADGNGGTFHVEVDGKDVTGSITVPTTGGWESFTTLTRDGIPLAAGAHAVRVVLDTNGPYGVVGNFDWFKFVGTGGTSTPVATTPVTAAPVTTAAGAYVPNTWAIPNGPFGLFTSTKSSSSLAVSFYDNSDNEAAYLIERASWSGGAYSVVATVSVDQATSQGKGLRTWVNTGLSSGSTYYYRVTAINQIGASSSTTGSGTTW